MRPNRSQLPQQSLAKIRPPAVLAPGNVVVCSDWDLSPYLVALVAESTITDKEFSIIPYEQVFSNFF